MKLSKAAGRKHISSPWRWVATKATAVVAGNDKPRDFGYSARVLIDVSAEASW